jgi:hypothetical protein
MMLLMSKMQVGTTKPVTLLHNMPSCLWELAHWTLNAEHRKPMTSRQNGYGFKVRQETAQQSIESL